MTEEEGGTPAVFATTPPVVDGVGMALTVLPAEEPVTAREVVVVVVAMVRHCRLISLPVDHFLSLFNALDNERLWRYLTM